MLILLAETDYNEVYKFLDEKFGKGKYFVKRDGTIRDYAHGWDVSLDANTKFECIMQRRIVRHKRETKSRRR